MHITENYETYTKIIMKYANTVYAFTHTHTHNFTTISLHDLVCHGVLDNILVCRRVEKVETQFSGPPYVVLFKWITM